MNIYYIYKKSNLNNYKNFLANIKKRKLIKIKVFYKIN